MMQRDALLPILLFVPLLAPATRAAPLQAADKDPIESRASDARFASRAPARAAVAIFVDAPGDGAIWVRGTGYKASFAADGTTFHPRLGARANAGTPLTLAPASLSIGGLPVAFERAVAPELARDAVTYSRGSFVERYTLSSGSIEQVFVLDELPGRGELVLRIETRTKLVAREDAAGLRFESEVGGATYGRALALDAAGRTAPLSTVHADGAIEIRVPASFLAAAVLPLTIDPVIATYTLDAIALDDFAPDVAYDRTTDRYLVCYEETFNASDHDVYSETFDTTGAVLAAQYVDYTTNDWRHPRVANNELADQFMVVAHVGSAGSRSIMACTVAAATGTLGNQVTVAPSFSNYERVNPDIGGDPNLTGTTHYLVVFEETNLQTGNRSIVQQLMKTNGQPDGFAPTCIDCNPGKRFNPAISKSAGRDGTGVDNRWNIVWEYQDAPGDHDIYGAQNFNSLTIGNPFAINTSPLDDRNPTASSFTDASGTPGNWMVAFQRGGFFVLDTDIHAHVMNGPTTIVSANLSVLEGPTFASQDQILPDADSDGHAFAVAYSELYHTSSEDWDVYLSSFTFTGSAIEPIETHQNLAYTSEPDFAPQMTAARGGPALQWMTCWARLLPTHGDIHGGLYAMPTIVPYCFPGSEGVAACPCGNAPQGPVGCDNSASSGGALLTGVGSPSLSADSFYLSQSGELGSSLSIFLQGNADIASGAVFGGGVRCVGGTLKRLYVHGASGGGVDAPVGVDLPVSEASAALGDVIPAGATRFYQVYYRDPDVSFCPAGFNVGNGLKVLWLP